MIRFLAATLISTALPAAALAQASPEASARPAPRPEAPQAAPAPGVTRAPGASLRFAGAAAAAEAPPEAPAETSRPAPAAPAPASPALGSPVVGAPGPAAPLGVAPPGWAGADPGGAAGPAAGASLASLMPRAALAPLARPEATLEAAPAAVAAPAPAAVFAPVAEGAAARPAAPGGPARMDAGPDASALALQRAIALMREGRWSDARAAVSRSGEVARDVIAWHALREQRGTWEEAQAFLARRPGWPAAAQIRERAEGLIPVDLAPRAVLAFFAGRAPATGTGALRLSDALRASGRPDLADETLVAAWRTMPMGEGAEAQVLARAGARLEPHHAARLDMLLWQDPAVGALRMMERVGPGERALARARLGLRSGAAGIDGLVAAVPRALQDDAGLGYERYRWRLDRGREDEAVSLMLARSVSREALGRPELWAGQRERWARARMRAGEGDVAYALAAGHFLEDGTLRSDLEWLAGYVALRHLGDAQLALRHFEAAKDWVWTPISLGRMHYWRGRALEALGREDEAQAAYAEGGRYQTSFYGQLAAEAAGLPTAPALAARAPARPMPEAIASHSALEAADLLRGAGERHLAARFLGELATGRDAAAIAHLGAWAAARGDAFLQVKLGKRAAEMGIEIPEHAFPLHPLMEADLPVDAALALSIARRESEFHPGVASHVGAQGLMQLMPATAREVAQGLGLPYSHARLTSDPAYNARLGSAYLAGLEARFGRNVPMVAAGYNAGPGRPARWASERGDPRAPGTDAIDWIEHIPFEETRNYVMRVMESVPVYRMRLSGVLEPLRVSEELKAR